jgi:hypothetical protein
MRHAYILEVGPRDIVFARRVYYGQGAALERATRMGVKLAQKWKEYKFYITDSTSAKTDKFVVEGDEFRRVR